MDQKQRIIFTTEYEVFQDLEFVTFKNRKTKKTNKFYLDDKNLFEEFKMVLQESTDISYYDLTLLRAILGKDI